MSGDQSIFAHYIFMDNEFSLPTASGFPLKFTLSGTFAPGAEGGLRMEPGRVLNIVFCSVSRLCTKMYNTLLLYNDLLSCVLLMYPYFFSQGELSFSPSMAVEFVTRMGVHIPKCIVSAVEMHTNMFHESSFNAKITRGDGQIKLSILPPKNTIELFRVR